MPTFGLFVLLFRFRESGDGIDGGLIEGRFVLSEVFYV